MAYTEGFLSMRKSVWESENIVADMTQHLIFFKLLSRYFYLLSITFYILSYI